MELPMFRSALLASLVFALGLIGCDDHVPGTVLVQNNLDYTLDRSTVDGIEGAYPDAPEAMCEVAVDYADETNVNYQRAFIAQGGSERFSFIQFLQDNGIASIAQLTAASVEFQVYCYADREYWFDDEQCGDEYPCDRRREFTYYGDFISTLTTGGVVSLEEDTDGELVIVEIAP